MIHWNKRLIPMLPKLISKIIVMAILLSTYGCNSSITTISNAMFYDAIFDKMKMVVTDNKIPYFKDIDTSSYYFDIIQTLVEWNIIKVEDELNLEENLNNDTFCKSILRIKQIDEDINTCYKLGYIDKLDKETLVEKDKALKVLDEIVKSANNKQFKPEYHVNIDENIKEIDDVMILDDNMIQSNYDLKVDDIISFDNNYYQIIDKQDNIYRIVKTNDIFEDLNLSYSDELTFDDAIIEDELVESNNLIFYNSLNDPITKYSYIKSKSFKYKEFDIKLTLNTSSIVIKATRNIKGNEAYISYKLYNVKPSYNISINDHKLDKAYFKIDFKTLASCGVKNGISKTLYADFAKLDPNDFINSAQNLFKEKQDIIDTTIDIATIKVPIPDTPDLYVHIKLQLVIYTSGRIELSVNGDHELGLEYQNGNMRFINDNDFKSDFVIKANTSLVAKSVLGLSFNKLSLMDVFAQGGIKGIIQSVLHIYDNNNEHTIINTDMELDFLDEIAQDNDHVYVCGDIDVYNILNVGMNSSKTLLAKMGMSKTYNILTENNSSLLKGKNHLENFIFVDKCTRYNKKVSSTAQIINSDNILVEDYSLLVKTGESVAIKIKALPNGISLDDLVFTSNNDNVKVDKNIITGVNKGNAIIDISSKDNKYHANCHILITDK